MDTTVFIARAPTGLIVRGGPGVRTAERGGWAVMVDDFGRDDATPRRLAEILADADADVDAVACALRHFDTPRYELFALLGPEVAVVGSAPSPSSPFCTGVLLDPDEGVVAVGFVDADAAPAGWLTIPNGTAIARDADGRQLLCDLRRRWVRPFVQTDRPTERNSERTAMSVSSSS